MGEWTGKSYEIPEKGSLKNLGIRNDFGKKANNLRMEMTTSEWKRICKELFPGIEVCYKKSLKQNTQGMNGWESAVVGGNVVGMDSKKIDLPPQERFLIKFHLLYIMLKDILS